MKKLDWEDVGWVLIGFVVTLALCVILLAALQPRAAADFNSVFFLAHTFGARKDFFSQRRKGAKLE